MVRWSKFCLLWITLLLVLTLVPKSVYASWPPFEYSMVPRYENGKIIYSIELFKRVKWPMTEVVFKIPLPEGTRYLEGNAQATTTVDFDGAEITFFTSVLHEDIEVATFVVEVVDPAQTIVTAKTWISWQGEQPGSYWTENVDIDLTKPALDWPKPSTSRLRLEAFASAADNLITYTIYPRNIDLVKSVRMQDVQIVLPIPEGTTLQSFESPPAFAAEFKGREVSFFALELEPWSEIEPLKVKVSREGLAAPVVTHAWATWKNTGRRVGRNIVPQEETRTGDIIVQPQTSQLVLTDMIGDVPYSYYDLMSVAFENGGSAFRVIFYTAEAVGPGDEEITYNFFIDSDCNRDTGGSVGSYKGIEYRVRPKSYQDRTALQFWNESIKDWTQVGVIDIEKVPQEKIISLWLPYSLLGNPQQFCWVAETINRSTRFTTPLPADRLEGDNIPEYYLFKTDSTIGGPLTPVPLAEESSQGGKISSDDLWQYLPGWSEPAADWSGAAFDDSAWLSGPTRMGYGKGKFATDLSLVSPPQIEDASLMVQKVITETDVVLAVPNLGSNIPSVYLRHPFTVDNPTSLSQLMLRIEYDGGFVAYLNGIEVARRGLELSGSPVAYDTLAAPQKERISEDIDLSSYLTSLTPGLNVLAIQVHRSIDNPTLSVTPALTWSDRPANAVAVGSSPDVADSALPAPAPLTEISGKLAVPLNSYGVTYDVHIFSLPEGQELAKIPNARQPNFSFDGQRLLINHEGAGIENVFEYNVADGTEKPVSDAPQDWHPFYDPWGNRVVYGNAELAYGKPEQQYSPERNKYYFTGVYKPFIFVQCGLLPPHQEQEPRCRDIPTLGVLVPAGQGSEIQGTNPVWTSNDMIAYKGCNSWSGFAACGVYLVPSASTKGFSSGFIPRQLSKETSDTPTDTKGYSIAFMSQRDGNWEVYLMDLNGNNVRNLSNSPDSNDGLATLSPDESWVAFVSDRGGSWAIWAAPTMGGSAQKLFDLPAVPWLQGKLDWVNERISWGP